ncbi:hypothetical protein B296_00034000 [Ensete ventricosum]|uniref:ABC transporter domain-containing protein n=1 Tax=Ensete ventricosum TaxID=4639 RepID=A0A426YE41_ENSVE|nr:hypothetical protein B296_00034000 [Ensete ventricosum]
MESTEVNRIGSMRRNSSIWRRGNESIFSASSREEDDEEALKWAALEKLPTFDRVRRGILSLPEGSRRLQEVDVQQLGFRERKALIERLVHVADEDNERFLLKLKDRVDRPSWVRQNYAVVGFGWKTELRSQGNGRLFCCPSFPLTICCAVSDSYIRKQSQATGKTTYNGHEMHEFVPQRTAAYISQHDLHIGEMTVRETLAFSARCQGVGTRYGEMLVGPARALFMDEISTGLDSSTTFQIVNSLRQSVHILGGTAVISLLQPAPETYELFDDIILLSDGQVVYQGPRQNVLEFFESMGFKCPERKGVADFLQEVTSRKDQQQYWTRHDEPYRYVPVREFAEAFHSFHVGRAIGNELSVPYDKSKSHPAALTTTRYGVSNKELLKANIDRELLLMKRNSFVYIFKATQLLIKTKREWSFHSLHYPLPLTIYDTPWTCRRPGVLTALMGVSGAGKTTLMDVLAGRKTGGYIEGNITISGYPKKQETFARVSGYCEQNDIHSPHVTVYESLVYSAWLRLPAEVNSATRKMFVDEVMELVELTPLRDALVGLPGVNGLSTEQRKRLTIAVELVANPSIIFMDEPTSGLDARAAAIVMRTVRNTVDTGRTVVDTKQDLFNAMGSMYAAVLFIGVQNSSSVQPVVAIERTVFYRERAAGMYSAVPYAIPVWWRWYYWICPVAWTLYGLVASQFGDIYDQKIDNEVAVADFVRDYFGFKHSFLGVVAVVVLAFPVLFAFLFAFSIKTLNFQKR